MLSWLTESSLVPMVLGTFIALAFFALAISFRDKIMFYIALVVMMLTTGVAVTEILIVTDREAVTEVVQALAQAVENNDLNGVLRHVSDKRDDAKSRIRNEMPQYKFRSCRILKILDFSVAEDSNPKTAEIEFVTLATGSSQHGEGTIHRTVKLIFEKGSDEKWLLIDYEHYDPHQDVRL